MCIRDRFEIGAGGSLPFGFTGKTVDAAGLRGQPLAVKVGIKPGDAGDGLFGITKILIGPERRRVRAGGAEEMCVFGVGDLGGGEPERVNQHAVNWAFAILAGGGAHKE